MPNVAHSQPEHKPAAAPSPARDAGSIDRLLAAFPDQRPGQEWTWEVIDDKRTKSWSGAVKGLLELPMAGADDDKHPKLLGLPLGAQRRRKCSWTTSPTR